MKRNITSAAIFAFGANWKRFVREFVGEDRIDEAKKSLCDFIGVENLKGRSFVDVGCGSGLFSLAAHRLGASRIVSFDVDRNSVDCCEYLREKEGKPSSWSVFKGDVLDREFLAEPGKFDIVYSWGVLHHTGDMWRALENTAGLVVDGGLLYIALYNRADAWGFHPDGRFGPSSFWKREKQFYCRLPDFAKSLVNLTVMSLLIAGYLLTFKNPIRKIREHKKYRGMAWSVDIVDWLGGYPYEYARPEEVSSFCQNRLGLTLQNLKVNPGLMNNEYLFRKALL